MLQELSEVPRTAGPRSVHRHWLVAWWGDTKHSQPVGPSKGHRPTARVDLLNFSDPLIGSPRRPTDTEGRPVRRLEPTLGPGGRRRLSSCICAGSCLPT